MVAHPIVLGLNSGHDASAALAIDGKIRAAISEERLTRHKHQTGFPINAIHYCLEAGGLDPSAQIDCIVMDQPPPGDDERFIANAIPCSYDSKLIVNPSHHFLHACYARAASGLTPSAILIVDGSGYSYGEYLRRNSMMIGPLPEYEEACEALTMYYFDEQGNVSIIGKQWGMWSEMSRKRLRFPSLGHMYSLAAQHIFGSWVHAGKVMGLAPYGNSKALDFDIVKLTETGVEIDVDWILNIPLIPENVLLEENPLARNLSAKVQAELEKAMFHLVNILKSRTGCKSLCLSGGVALNSVCNGRIAREGPFDNVFITPAAHDSGVAIGAAAMGYKELTGEFPRFDARLECFGRHYAESEALNALSQFGGLHYEKEADPAVRAAQDLSEGLTIGWFEGASEFGPRALGHRSILADARNSGIKDYLNSKVKFRESFRPYAAVVLEHRCAEWFDFNGVSPHMLLVMRVPESRRRIIPGVVHIDGTCRVQTVGTDYPGAIHRLLEHFERLTGVPLVLNTSFNMRGEPICETPYDALRCFMSSGLDVLYLENRRVTKWPNLKESDGFELCIPVLQDGCSLTRSRQSRDGKWQVINYIVSSYGTRRFSIDQASADLLESIDGQRTVAEIIRMQPHPSMSNRIIEELCNFRDNGLLYFRSSTVL